MMIVRMVKAMMIVVVRSRYTIPNTNKENRWRRTTTVETQMQQDAAAMKLDDV